MCVFLLRTGEQAVYLLQFENEVYDAFGSGRFFILVTSSHEDTWTQVPEAACIACHEQGIL